MFVCEHGAGRSRVAAALFAASAPAGWRAASAGLSPQERVSPHAAALLGADARWLDRSPPAVLAPAPGDLVIAIDCDVAGARRWTLRAPWPDPRVGDELRVLIGALVAEEGGDDDHR